MDNANHISLAYPVALTPGGTINIGAGDPVLVRQHGPNQVMAWIPPTTPEVTTPRSASPSEVEVFQTPLRPPRRRRRRRVLAGEEFTVTPLDRDSGSERESGGEDDDDEMLPREELALNDMERLRAVARELEELHENMLEEDGSDLEEYEWSTNFDTFTGTAEQYTLDPGPKFAGQDPVELFQQIWDLEIVQKIVDETNDYAWNYIAAISEQGEIPANLHLWTETTVEEIYRYLGILMLMAICPLSRVKDFWTTGILGMPDFRSFMSRNRYQMLSRFLHFVDNASLPHDLRSYERKVCKIAPIVDHCNTKFQGLYVPERELSLDESLLLWKGHLSWVQCIRTKAARFGIKSFELCEAKTGYTLRTLIYAGKNSALHEGPIHGFSASTAKIVLKLMDGFLDVGHLLIMDNFYNQIPLTRYLKRRHTDIIGTLNRRRQHVPPIIKSANERQLRAGAVVSCHSGDVSITSWKDVKLVTILSTYHGSEMVVGSRAGQYQEKPVSVSDYNKYMGGVDLKDQKLSMYLLERKRGLKWYIKVFRRLVNTSILNSYIIYCKNPTPRVLTHRDYRLQLAESLCGRYARVEVPRPTLAPPSTEKRLNRFLLHFPVLTEKKGNRHVQRRCARCSVRENGARRAVSTVCSDCNVGLCIECWFEYHTLPNLNA